MKRSFRVATVFTGAAACAAVITPAAQAAPMALGPTARITPDAVTVGKCSPNVNGNYNTLELVYTASEHHSPVCFHGSGYWFIGSGVKFAEYCADSKSGFLDVNNMGGEKFTPGTHDLYGQYVEAVSIEPGGAAHPCGA
jgi:hypothetical protein